MIDNLLNGVPFNSAAYSVLSKMMKVFVYNTNSSKYLNCIPKYEYEALEEELKYALGYTNDQNVPGCGIAFALLGCLNDSSKSIGGNFGNLAFCETMRSIAASSNAKAEMLANKNIFKAICKSAFLKEYFGLTATKQNPVTQQYQLNTVPTQTFMAVTTSDKPFIYIHTWPFVYHGQTLKINLVQNDIKYNIYTSPRASSGSGNDGTQMDPTDFVVDPLADYGLNRTVTIEYEGAAGFSSNYDESYFMTLS